LPLTDQRARAAPLTEVWASGVVSWWVVSMTVKSGRIWMSIVYVCRRFSAQMPAPAFNVTAHAAATAATMVQ
jgi:hypothetical protein